MKRIVFLTHTDSYNAGEVAGFADDVADAYIAKGVAEAAPDEPEAGEEKPAEE